MDNTQNYCFCELAPLYVLDLLSKEEKVWVEQQVSDCPDLAEELASYHSAVTAIPYSVPTLPIAENLKNRLFERLKLDAPPDLPKSDTRFLNVRSQDLNWQPHPVSGVFVAIVHTDKVKREIVGFLRAEPGVHYPFHLHAANEEILMLEGDLVVGDKVFGAGDYIRSNPGSSHAPHTNGGCKFFFHTSMDDQYPSLSKL